MEQHSRTALLLGEAGVARLQGSRVAVFGLGGVGGYAVEALARAGVGCLELIDHDTISLTNLNRQLLATHATLGMEKSQAAAERVRAIDPGIQAVPRDLFFGADTLSQFDFSGYDYVIDAIDTVSCKLLLAQACQAAGTPLISSMGTGNKLDPTAFRIADISETHGCPLARIMRKECKKRGIRRLKVVYSPEEPLRPQGCTEAPPEGRRAIPGSVSFVPAAAGLILAGEVIRHLAGQAASGSL